MATFTRYTYRYKVFETPLGILYILLINTFMMTKCIIELQEIEETVRTFYISTLIITFISYTFDSKLFLLGTAF